MEGRGDRGGEEEAERGLLVRRGVRRFLKLSKDLEKTVGGS